MNRRGWIVAGLALALTPGFAAAQDKSQRKKGGGASFIQLDTLTATIIRIDGRRGVMTVECGVDVPDAGLHARAAQSTPLLHAAFAEVVRTYAAGLPPGAPPNADYLSLQLQRQTDLTLGRPGAKLLLGAILVN
ncbi:MAG TPA: Tat pathway signal protein [Caulobacteraceae bacterium]|nr:Tat pathway signal protein [Caulobacteraceae bacterium]